MPHIKYDPLRFNPEELVLQSSSEAGSMGGEYVHPYSELA